MEEFQGIHGEDDSDKERVMRKPDLLRQEKAKARDEEGLNGGRPLLACRPSGPTRRLFLLGTTGMQAPWLGSRGRLRGGVKEGMYIVAG